MKLLILSCLAAAAFLTLTGCATDKTALSSTINSSPPVTVSNPFIAVTADAQTE